MASADKSLFADILSVLAMTYSDTQLHGTLCYHLLSASLRPAGSLVRTEADVAKGLIGEYVDNKSVPLKASAIMGLGLAYTGSHREDSPH
ncbi:hypothetical protein B0H13DRAFT_2325120 [Mycena leptocephala]|nr:hypothetical protein B0H13DRAFT_2325120 [Mycena leptocephala]